MAIYKQVQERMLQPFHYLAANGLEASHDTPEGELALDDRGQPAVAFGELEKRNDRLIYTSGADVSLMTEDELEKAFYAFDEATVNRMVNHGAMVELERDSAPSPETDAVASAEEPIHASDAAKREAQKRGVDLENLEGTGSDGMITVGDVKKAASDPKDDEVRTWEED